VPVPPLTATVTVNACVVRILVAEGDTVTVGTIFGINDILVTNPVCPLVAAALFLVW
jgi:hypothetical protein